jgi:DGQHR domain-containing protein
MKEYLINLTKDKDEINKIFKVRSKPYEEKTVSGKTIELAREKAEIETKEGWSIVPRKFKKSVKLRKLKPLDVRLEDEVWSLLVKMGFDEYSKDRYFKIFVDDKTPARQIDVFAKDNETALLVECTCCDERKEKNLNDLLEKILSIRSEAFASINNHYDFSEKLKIRFIIVTQNIEWRKADLDKAEANNIVILRDEELDYYKKLTELIKTAAKYQLLAQVFSQEKIHELDIKVPATRGKMGGQTFYNFLIRPFDLLKIAFISHKQSRNIEDFETYQRMLNPRRLESIAMYIDNGGQFPTNIVINIKTKKDLRFDKKEAIGESSFGTLYLPSHYGSAWVIDGQHRLYGYVYSKRIEKGGDDKTTFPVLAYENLPPMKEADLFVDINSKQERVKQNLIKEIYANLKWESKDEKEKLDALRSKTAIKLNSVSKSPFYERFSLSNASKTHFCCLTLTSFVDGLKENKFYGELTSPTKFKPGFFYASYDEKLDTTLEKGCQILIYYFNLFKTALPKHCELGDDTGGFLFTNNGIRSLLIILKEILAHIQNELKSDLDDLPAEEIVKYLDNYVNPLTLFFESASLDMIKEYRSRQALAGVNRNAVELMSFIHNHIPDFRPDKLKVYLEQIDVEGTKVARSLIDEIQISMYNYVIKRLEEKYGEHWWYEGIPGKIRTECVNLRESEKGIKNKEQYLSLIDYQSIAHVNWDLFEIPFSRSKEGGKEKKLKWVKELSTIRNITHHVEKWPAMKDQVAFVKDVHKHVIENFK